MHRDSQERVLGPARSSSSPSLDLALSFDGCPSTPLPAAPSRLPPLWSALLLLRPALPPCWWLLRLRLQVILSKQMPSSSGLGRGLARRCCLAKRGSSLASQGCVRLRVGYAKRPRIRDTMSSKSWHGVGRARWSPRGPVPLWAVNRRSA